MGRLSLGLMVCTVLVAASCAGERKARTTAPPPLLTTNDQAGSTHDGGATPIGDPAWTTPANATSPADDRPVVVTEDELLLCADKDKQIKSFDVSGDGKTDVWKLYVGAGDAGPGVLTCKKTDLNFDGKVDMAIGYGADGSMLFEQLDITFDGRIDVVKRYDSNTKLAIEVARDSNSDGIFDIFESFGQDGKLLLVARDRNGDNALDVWEIHEDGELVESQFDDDYDGVVDRSE